MVSWWYFMWLKIMLDHRVADGGRQVASGRGGRGNIKTKDQFAPPPIPMDRSHCKHSSASSANMPKEMVSWLYCTWLND